MSEEGRAVSLAERLRAVTAVTDVSIRNLDVDDFLTELLARVSSLLNADTAAVLLLDAESQTLVARAALGIEEEVRQGARVRVGRGFAGRVASEGRPIMLSRVDPSTVENPILWQKGIRAMLGVPLQRGSRVLGVLHVGSLVERIFTADDAELLELAGERIAAAMEAR
jgi:sigma-B regulation protein RsbU (phosphoserine phosphatase)